MATDPNGVAGAGTYAQFGANGWFDRKLEYCQRFWPDTIEVVEAGEELISGFRNRYNLGNFTTIKMTYECVQNNATNNTEWCFDSDGINYYIKGIRNSTYGIDNDSCRLSDDLNGSNVFSGPWLLELYCEGNNVGSEFYGCPGGCIDGACITNTTNQSCIDSDGENYFVFGNVTVMGGGVTTVALDSCINDITVSEGTCVNNNLFILNKNCTDFGQDYFCSNGACILNNSNQTHKICSAEECLTVNGPGIDECVTSYECSNDSTNFSLGEGTEEGEGTFWERVRDFFRNIF